MDSLLHLILDLCIKSNLPLKFSSFVWDYFCPIFIWIALTWDTICLYKEKATVSDHPVKKVRESDEVSDDQIPEKNIDIPIIEKPKPPKKTIFIIIRDIFSKKRKRRKWEKLKDSGLVILMH